MLIYAAADIHGHMHRIRQVEKQVAIHRPDLLVLAGDISRRRRPEVVLAALNRLDLPVLLVRGNSDCRALDRLIKPFPHLRDAHLSRVRVDDVAFVGVGGTLPLPFHSRLGVREAETVARISGLLKDHSVLVVHPPPYGVRDRVLGRFHAGSRAVRRLVDTCSPALVLCGHIHEQAGVATIGRTVVVNCAMGRSRAGAMIRYNGRSTPVGRVLLPDG